MRELQPRPHNVDRTLTLRLLTAAKRKRHQYIGPLHLALADAHVRRCARCHGFGGRSCSARSGLAAPALASTSSAQLWTALAGRVTCGVAIHPPNSPPMQLLCSARVVPAPRRRGSAIRASYFSRSTRPSLRGEAQVRTPSSAHGRTHSEVGAVRRSARSASRARSALRQSAARTGRITDSRSRLTPIARSERARGRSDRHDHAASAVRAAAKPASAQALPLTS